MLFAITIVRNTGELLKGSSGSESSEQRKGIGSLAQERCGTRKEKGVQGSLRGAGEQNALKVHRPRDTAGSCSWQRTF